METRLSLNKKITYGEKLEKNTHTYVHENF